MRWWLILWWQFKEKLKALKFKSVKNEQLHWVMRWGDGEFCDGSFKVQKCLHFTKKWTNKSSDEVMAIHWVFSQWYGMNWIHFWLFWIFFGDEVMAIYFVMAIYWVEFCDCNTKKNWKVEKWRTKIVMAIHFVISIHWVEFCDGNTKEKLKKIRWKSEEGKNCDGNTLSASRRERLECSLIYQAEPQGQMFFLN